LAGDRDPWHELLSRHGPALVLFARQWVASAADAEDAVQDGFIRFWQARSRAREDVGYLYACVRTAAMDLSRAGQRREKADHDSYPATLAELTPKDLATVPLDSFSETPLRYAPTAKGYTLYSVGPNLNDDGGKDSKPGDDVAANVP
jgi:RNA polymerase sigma factor (sigma-70 family)